MKPTVSRPFPNRCSFQRSFIVLLVWKNNPFRLSVWLTKVLTGQKPRMHSSAVNYGFLSHSPPYRPCPTVPPPSLLREIGFFWTDLIMWSSLPLKPLSLSFLSTGITGLRRHSSHSWLFLELLPPTEQVGTVGEVRRGEKHPRDETETGRWRGCLHTCGYPNLTLLCF